MTTPPNRGKSPTKAEILDMLSRVTGALEEKHPGAAHNCWKCKCVREARDLLSKAGAIQ